MRRLFAGFALLLICGPVTAHATIALVGAVQTNENNTTALCAVTKNVGVGDLLVVTSSADYPNATGSPPVISGYSNTGPATLTWTNIGPLAGVNYHSTINGNSYITTGAAYAVATASGTYTVTVTYSSAIDNCGQTLAEMSGANITTPLDTNVGLPVNNGGVNTSGAPSVSGVSTTCAPDMIIETTGWFGTGGDPPSQTTGTGFSTVAYTTADAGSGFGAVATQFGVSRAKTH